MSKAYKNYRRRQSEDLIKRMDEKIESKKEPFKENNPGVDVDTPKVIFSEGSGSGDLN